MLLSCGGAWAESTDQVTRDLARYVGLWEVRVSVVAREGASPAPAMTFDGTADIRLVGSRWIVRRIHAMSGTVGFDSEDVMGYDAAVSSWIGVWADSRTRHLFHGHGSRDATGSLLMHVDMPHERSISTWADSWSGTNEFLTTLGSAATTPDRPPSITIRHVRLSRGG